ncbi:MAG: hypothetical protein JWN03_3275 [Nocardia sp.]|nr:hypothetical protein [Nocardia sp.]
MSERRPLFCEIRGHGYSIALPRWLTEELNRRLGRRGLDTRVLVWGRAGLHVGGERYRRAVNWFGGGRLLRPGDSAPGESVAEGSIFAILNFVFGTGRRSYRVGGRYELRADMFFVLGEWEERLLVVEYDGEYWHREREETDMRKICETLSLGSDFDVIRLRQQPLRRLRPADISVPRRADAMTCARLVLLHITHRPGPFLPDHGTLDRILQFLEFGAIPLPEDVIVCDACLELNYVLQEDYPGGAHGERHVTAMRRSHFMEVATALSRLGERPESAWRPEDRDWEHEEIREYEKRGFRAELEQLREASRPPAPSNPAPSTQVGSTFPLITKAETGWIEGS